MKPRIASRRDKDIRHKAARAFLNNSLQGLFDGEYRGMTNFKGADSEALTTPLLPMP